MSESKKTSGGKKSTEQTRAEAAEALRKAAELIASLNQTEDEPAEAPKKPAAKKAPAKKPATKKPAAKKPAAKKPAAKPVKAEEPAATEEKAPEKKPVAKKPATKKPTAKKAPAKKPPQKKPEPKHEEIPTEEITEEATPLAEEPVQEEVAAVEEPVQEQVQPEEPQPVEEPVEEPVEQAKVEEPPKPVEQAPQPAVTTTTKTVQTTTETVTVGGRSFKQKSSDFVNNKGKLPIFIVANVLLALCSILLIVSAFNVTSYLTGKTEGYTLFGYFGESAHIKDLLGQLAFEWADGGYIVISILMILAFIVPIALIVKNIVLLVKNKDKNVHLLDAVVTVAFLLAYMGIVNLYGANMTAGQIVSLVASLLLLAFTVFVMLVSGSDNRLPIFSVVNIVLSVLCVFLITAAPIYSPSIYAAGAASMSGGASFAFILLLATVAALVLLVIMQLIKKLPALLELIVPIAACVLALVALITLAGAMPDGFSIGGGFVVGVVLTLLMAIANILFTLVPPLKKFKVQVKDVAPQTVTVRQTVTVTRTVTQNGAEVVSTDVKQSYIAENGNIICIDCETENEPDSLFCCKCGRKLK